MSARDNGGPAFPSPELGVQDYGQRGAYPGLTVRDYFAAKAMHQMLAGAVLPAEYDATKELSMLGARAYEVADAMLKARTT